MIDGVKLSCVGLNADLWRASRLLDFGISVSESTGEVLNQRREAKYRDMRFVLSPCVKGGFSCFMSGSLHKYAKGDNYSDFSYSDLSDTLDNLTENHFIDLENAYIHGMEIGVNIELPYSPEIVFKKAIVHKGVPFEKLDAKNKRLGVICHHANYAIKLYDKSLQCKINNKYILRYEVKLLKQKELKPYDITTLADLQNGENIAKLINVLLSRLNEIVFFDDSFNPKGLSTTKLLSWQKYGNPRYWQGLNPSNTYKARRKLADLTERYNCIDWGQFLAKKVTEKWLKLTISKQEKRRCFPRLSEPQKAGYYHSIFIQGKQIKKAMLSPLDYIKKNVAERGRFQSEKKEVDNDAKQRKKINQKKTKKKNLENTICYCVSCGRKLTGQKKGSRFCSEKIYGKAARKCRNKDSNKRLSTKRKIQRAKDKGMMLRITYADARDESSVLLAASRVRVTRKWLDRVKGVERLKPRQSDKAG